MTTFGRVPHPPHQRRIVENSRAWDNLGARTIRAVCWHRMIGTLWGTDGYFRGAAVGIALTDYGIGVAGTDGQANDGLLLMWNDPRGTRAPWANGRVSAPYGDGLAFVRRYGIAAVNRDIVSIEISGRTWDAPLSEASRQMIAHLTAYWADQYRVPWDSFPMVPSEGRSFVTWHQEFTIGTGKVCPGQVVMSETNALIARARDILRNWQTAAVAPPPPPAYARPQPVAAGTRVLNDRLFLDIGGQTYTIRQRVTPRLWADPTSPATGPDLEPGAQVTVSHVVRDMGDDAGVTLVLADGSRIPGRAIV